MDAQTQGRTVCPGCGAAVPDLPGKPHPYIGASMGCWEIYGQILAKEYGEYNYPVLTHRLTVDTYAVQHPGTPGRRSIQSVNGHLVSLCLVLEQGLDGRAATQALGKVLQHVDRFTWLEPPTPNGRLTVLDIVDAGSLEEHKESVLQWARDVWEAWNTHHDRIHEMIRWI